MGSGRDLVEGLLTTFGLLFTDRAHPPPSIYYIINPIHHAIRLILYDTASHISSGIHGSSLVPSHLKLQDDFIGEQGLAALAFGKIEEVYEIEEAHEIEDRRHWGTGARCARIGEI
jgi:hypothetical protein